MIFFYFLFFIGKEDTNKEDILIQMKIRIRFMNNSWRIDEFIFY